MVKKTIKIIIFLCILFSFVFPTFASETEKPKISYEKEYNDFIGGLPGDLLPYLPEEIISSDMEKMGEAAGKMTDPKSFLSIVFDMLGFYVKDAFAMLARLIAIVLISALAHHIFTAFGSSETKGAFEFLITAIIAAVVIKEQMGFVKMVDHFLSRLLALVNSMLPLIGVLTAAGGNLTTAASGTATLSFYIALCENLCALTLMPIVGVCFAFSIASAFSSGAAPGEISVSLKKIYTYGLGFLMAIMALVMSVQNQLASKADSLGARAAKYAVGSFIPVLGGTIGDSLRTVAASVEYIKGAAGTIAIIIILLLLLPPLISLAICKCSIGISLAVAKIFGCEKESRLLSEIGNAYGYMMAVCSICSVLFIYALTLFVKTGAAIGG